MKPNIDDYPNEASHKKYREAIIYYYRRVRKADSSKMPVREEYENIFHFHFDYDVWAFCNKSYDAKYDDLKPGDKVYHVTDTTLVGEIIGTIASDADRWAIKYSHTNRTGSWRKVYTVLQLLFFFFLLISPSISLLTHIVTDA